MTFISFLRFTLCLFLSMLVACGGTAPSSPVHAAQSEPAHDHDADAEDAHDHAEDDPAQLHLSAAQIRTAGIEIAPVTTTTGGSLTLPAIIIADPARSASISAGVPGRVQQAPAGLGMPVKAGTVLAVIDSAEAAELGAELQAAQQQAQLMHANLEREERLFAEKISPQVDVLAGRTYRCG